MIWKSLISFFFLVFFLFILCFFPKKNIGISNQNKTSQKLKEKRFYPNAGYILGMVKIKGKNKKLGGISYFLGAIQYVVLNGNGGSDPYLLINKKNLFQIGCFPEPQEFTGDFVQKLPIPGGFFDPNSLGGIIIQVIWLQEKKDGKLEIRRDIIDYSLHGGDIWQKPEKLWEALGMQVPPYVIKLQDIPEVTAENFEELAFEMNKLSPIQAK